VRKQERLSHSLSRLLDVSGPAFLFSELARPFGGLAFRLRRSKLSRRNPSNRISRYASLAFVLAAREFPGSYRGNATGALAAAVIPIAMLAVYSFVFSTMIPVRLEGVRSEGNYTLFLFSGLVVWNLFADVVVRGPRLFVGSPNYVHRPQFPLSLLVLAPCLAGLFRAVPWLAAYAAAHWYVIGTPTWKLAAAPLVLVVACGLTYGVTLCLAAIGALVRDVGDFIQPVVTLLFFLSPILYPASTIADKAEWVLKVNPVAPMLEVMRDLTFGGVVPALDAVVRLGAWTVGSILLGLLLYRLVRDALADLI
jgi:lipopolysaccharide transport system permease protein